MNRQEELLNSVLEQLARELDIPAYKYKEAMERYDAIRRHLRQGAYPGSTPPPAIYLQGSFRYGTVVRPLKDGKDVDFDIDMVCEVNREKEQDNPKTLKEDVGDEVKGYARKNSMSQPEDKRRCWTLEYAPDAEGIGFHVDVLPSLPDKCRGQVITEQNDGYGATNTTYTYTTIAITNRNDDVRPAEHSWRSSNPNGYAKWFYEICEPGRTVDLILAQKAMLFDAYRDRDGFYAQAEDIPDELVRTPLQRAIQIMKRHRDIRFNGQRNEKHKPISMVITTLAARLYAGKAGELTTTQSTLWHIIDLLSRHADLIEARALPENISAMQLIQRVGDKWYIPNPVNPHYPGDSEEKGENFADRWHEDNHAKARAFFDWIRWLRDDLNTILAAGSVSQMSTPLKRAFGERMAENVLRQTSKLPISGVAAVPVAKSSSTFLRRFDVPHRAQPKWPASRRYNLHIEGRATREGFRTLHSTDGFNHIAKGYSLRFEAITDTPKPYNVYWQVVNTGNEAERDDGLRGEIVSDDSIREETTRYTGFHWIECFVVKDNKLVARSGEFVVNIQ